MPRTGRPARARAVTASARPVLAQPAQVGHRGPAAGQDDQVSRGDLGRAGGVADDDRRLGRERVGVGEVADPRQPHHRDPQRVPVAGRGRGGGLNCPVGQGRGSPRCPPTAR